jgi:nitrate reductase NapAB chaperone NapD
MMGNAHSGLCLDADGPLVAGVVIETLPNRAPSVKNDLSRVDGLQIVGGDGDRRLAGVWAAESGETLRAAAEKLVRNHEDILGVLPTFIGTDEGKVDKRREDEGKA